MVGLGFGGFVCGGRIKVSPKSFNVFIKQYVSVCVRPYGSVVEHFIRNEKVASSIPASGTIKYSKF